MSALKCGEVYECLWLRNFVNEAFGSVSRCESLQHYDFTLFSTIKRKLPDKTIKFTIPWHHFTTALCYPRRRNDSMKQQEKLSLFSKFPNFPPAKLSLFISTKVQLRYALYLVVRCLRIIHSSTLTNTFKVRKISFFRTQIFFSLFSVWKIFKRKLI